MYVQEQIKKPFGIAFWFDKVTMSFIWYESRKERDGIMEDIKNGGQLKVKWDYDAYGRECISITPRQFYVIDAVGPIYHFGNEQK